MFLSVHLTAGNFVSSPYQQTCCLYLISMQQTGSRLFLLFSSFRFEDKHWRQKFDRWDQFLLLSCQIACFYCLCQREYITRSLLSLFLSHLLSVDLILQTSIHSMTSTLHESLMVFNDYFFSFLLIICYCNFVIYFQLFLSRGIA